MWKNKRRSLGAASASMMLSSMVCVSLLWICDLHNVQSDSQTELIQLNVVFPLGLMNFLPKIYSNASSICFFGLIIHLAAVYFCKTRSAADLIAVLFWLVTLTVHTIEICRWKNFFGGDKADLYVLQFCSSTCSTLIVFWLSILPRRRYRITGSRKTKSTSSRSNFSGSRSSGAFSTSTPRSMTPLDASKRFLPTNNDSSTMANNTWPQDLPDIFATSLVRPRDASPSRILGAKFSLLSLRSAAESPNKFANNSFSTTCFQQTSPVKQQTNLDGVTLLRPKSNSILAPAKFTVTPQTSITSTTTNGLWSNYGTVKSFQSPTTFDSSFHRSFWNKPEFSSSPFNNKPPNNHFCSADEDTVSLLSGYSTATCRKLTSGFVVNNGNSAKFCNSVETSTSRFDVWKFLVGLVLAFSMLTNVAVLYHIYVKK